jgi:hypothetical protein
MMRHCHSVVRPHVFPMLVLAFYLFSPSRLHAGSLPAWAANTEVMMNAETAEMTFIGRYFGPDNASPLSFTTNQDIKGQSFSFSLNSGSTYLGQSMNLTATGTFNTTTSQWNIATTGTFGPAGPNQMSWNSSYTASITGDPTFLIAGTTTVPVPGFPILDVKISGALVVSAPNPVPVILVTSNLTGQATVAAANVGPPFGVSDVLLSAGGWSLKTGGILLAGLDPNGGGYNFRVVSSGQVTPVTGGSGTFTSEILSQSIPEPSTVTLLIIGMLGMGVIGRQLRLCPRES